jgi:hypothetical protein
MVSLDVINSESNMAWEEDGLKKNLPWQMSERRTLLLIRVAIKYVQDNLTISLPWSG